MTDEYEINEQEQPEDDASKTPAPKVCASCGVRQEIMATMKAGGDWVAISMKECVRCERNGVSTRFMSLFGELKDNWIPRKSIDGKAAI